MKKIDWVNVVIVAIMVVCVVLAVVAIVGYVNGVRATGYNVAQTYNVMRSVGVLA